MSTVWSIANDRRSYLLMLPFEETRDDLVKKVRKTLIEGANPVLGGMGRSFVALTYLDLKRPVIGDMKAGVEVETPFVLANKQFLFDYSIYRENDYTFNEYAFRKNIPRLDENIAGNIPRKRNQLLFARRIFPSNLKSITLPAMDVDAHQGSGPTFALAKHLKDIFMCGYGMTQREYNGCWIDTRASTDALRRNHIKLKTADVTRTFVDNLSRMAYNGRFYNEREF